MSSGEYEICVQEKIDLITNISGGSMLFVIWKRAWRVNKQKWRLGC